LSYTNQPFRAEEIRSFYIGRAALEGRIRELKEKYALGRIPTNIFQANEAYFYLLLLASSTGSRSSACLPDYRE